MRVLKFVLKAIGKMLLLPVILLILICQLFVAVVQGVYGLFHVLFWILLMFMILVALFTASWPQLIIFVCFAMLSLAIVNLFEFIQTALGAARLGIVGLLLR